MVMSDDFVETPALARTLAGSTVLQIVPSLGQSAASRIAINVAHALVRAGGRAIVAGEDGALIDELKSFGGEWLSYADTTFNPLKLRKNVELLAKLLAREEIDIVHARSRVPGGSVGFAQTTVAGSAFVPQITATTRSSDSGRYAPVSSAASDAAPPGYARRRNASRLHASLRPAPQR
jgi:hypothetical protein